MIHLSPVEQGAGIGTATLDIKCANCNGSDSTRTGAYRLELGTKVLQEAIKEIADAATQTGECPVCGGHIEAKSEPEPQPDPWLEYSNYRMEMLRRKAIEAKSEPEPAARPLARIFQFVAFVLGEG